MKGGWMPAILVFVAWPLLAPAMASGDRQPLSHSETILLEKIEQNPTPLLYAELARIRLEKAASFYRQWGKSNNPEHLQQALIYADSAKRLSPDWDRPWTLLGMIHTQFRSDRQAQELATEALIRAVEINPANGEAQLLLAQVLMDQGRFWSAIEQYKSLFAKSAAMITPMNTAPLALCFILDGRIPAGVIYFEGLAAEHPGNPAAAVGRAVLLKNAGEPGKARKILSELSSSAMAGPHLRQYARDLLASWNIEERQ